MQEVKKEKKYVVYGNGNIYTVSFEV